MELNRLKLEAQGVLGELFNEEAMPFRLTAAKIESVGGEEYIVRFHGSRLHSVDVSWPAGESFKDGFRAAMLDRVSRMSGPLRKRTQVPQLKATSTIKPHWSLREPTCGRHNPTTKPGSKFPTKESS